MAYDRYDTRDAPRDERSRWREDRFEGREGRSERGRPDDRGFFERAGDEVASWFGDDEAERRRCEDRAQDERMGSDWNRDHDRERNRDRDFGRSYRDYRPMAGDYGR